LLSKLFAIIAYNDYYDTKKFRASRNNSLSEVNKAKSQNNNEERFSASIDAASASIDTALSLNIKGCKRETCGLGVGSVCRYMLLLIMFPLPRMERGDKRDLNILNFCELA
jgi:hypothetical protein